MPLRTERLALSLLMAFALAPEMALAEPPKPREEAKSVDEVGYASIEPSLGGFSAAYKAPRVPSHVEVTALSTGRTILVQVADRALTGGEHVVALSCDAARQLDLPDSGATAVRVRQYSPSAQESGALKAGNRVAERLPTPEPLLVVLRKKLPATAPKGNAPGLAACGVPAGSVKAAEPAPAPDKAPAKATPAAAPPAPKSPPKKVATDAPQPRAGDGFIIENAGENRTAAPREPASKASRPAPVATGRFAIQAVAVSSRAQADLLARRIGGFVEPAGKLFRVRKGPYADAASARSALQSVRAKGFADARMVTIGER